MRIRTDILYQRAFGGTLGPLKGKGLQKWLDDIIIIIYTN